ncbi:MAG: alpha/beta fold hydrolase [Deltaproteobacteria bacterium]|jgi:hypothetical protein|nr:alpha/beta fold hydrolase [Deltaproteobacteria bacterium]
MSMVSVNGIELYSEVRGKGEPLLLIAGLTAHSQHWSNQVPVFSKHFKTILLDNRNSGRSDVTNQGSIKLMADDVVGLMDALEVDRAHLVGRSMGGLHRTAGRYQPPGKSEPAGSGVNCTGVFHTKQTPFITSSPIKRARPWHERPLEGFSLLDEPASRRE